MAQYSTHNIVRRSPAVGQGRGVGHGSPSLTTPEMFPNAHNLQIVDSTVTAIGGDVVHDYSRHYHYERPRDIRAILESIPNFRQIYHDMLSKATEGTGMWLVKGDKFRVWLDPNGDIKIFWGSGIPGAGKTLLASIVIQHLEALCEETDAKICVCYVYFRYSDHAELTVRHILEILVMQTHQRHPECQALIEQMYARHLREKTDPTEAQLLSLLCQLNEGMAVTFYILDALDEAPTKIQLAIVETLASLNAKLFITSRPLKDVEADFPEAYTFHIIAQEADIDLHIAEGIKKNAGLRRLLQANASLGDEVISTIKQKCGGMFLHASLQLDALAECFSAQDVMETLKSFPSSIEDVYQRTWARISNGGRKHTSLAKAVLVWVLNASRSMTIEELQRAVATSPDNHKFEAGRLVPETTLLSLCGGLITVEEESRLVRLVHYTAKETLEGLLHEAFPHPHSLLATVCMTHLAECGFQNTTISSQEEFGNTLKRDPLLAYASEAWTFHARAELDAEDIRHQTAQFITTGRAFPAFTAGPNRTFYFDILTPLHILGLYDLPLPLIENTTNPNLRTKVKQQSALIIACRFGYEGLVASLLALSEIQVNLVEHDGWSALMEAAGNGHEGTVKLLLAHPEIQAHLVNSDGASALLLAARNGHEGTVKLLLAHPEIQANLVDNDGWSALMLAARNGHEGTVKLLLAPPGIQANLVANNGWSALMVAAQNGHDGTIKLLLAHPGILVNLVDNDGWSALMLAAQNGHEGTVKLLLAHPGILVNLVSNNAWSALMLAAWNGHEGTVKLLLAHPGIQANLVANDGWSALMVAAQNGHEGTVKLLLAHPGILVNLVSNNAWSALMAAAQNGHEGIVKVLLAHPATQLSPAMHQRHWSTPLHAAAYGGKKAVVELLLATGHFDVSAIDSDMDTAIKLAAKDGYEAIVCLLLDVPNIDITIRSTSDGHTAISAAQANGHSRIVELLQEFESRNAAVASPLGTHQLSMRDIPAEDGSDSDSSECYFDADWKRTSIRDWLLPSFLNLDPSFLDICLLVFRKSACILHTDKHLNSLFSTYFYNVPYHTKGVD
ncbi:ankyrin repeat-containing domain protein [Coprinopsis sp. MPI-PUGE-AT-0042]|nr:ankyrin repeat-containing domain protein [Coprinopsis sp. MPI-PUGE-AT-0042]